MALLLDADGSCCAPLHHSTSLHFTPVLLPKSSRTCCTVKGGPFRRSIGRFVRSYVRCAALSVDLLLLFLKRACVRSSLVPPAPTSIGPRVRRARAYNDYDPSKLIICPALASGRLGSFWSSDACARPVVRRRRRHRHRMAPRRNTIYIVGTRDRRSLTRSFATPRRAAPLAYSSDVESKIFPYMKPKDRPIYRRPSRRPPVCWGARLFPIRIKSGFVSVELARQLNIIKKLSVWHAFGFGLQGARRS